MKTIITYNNGKKETLDKKSFVFGESGNYVMIFTREFEFDGEIIKRRYIPLEKIKEIKEE